jgi:D-glycero-D-manno-heptose 1,7-bisphosphate phosphatase
MVTVAAARGAIFLDRDGVINVNRTDHVKCWDEFEFLPGALESIRRLTQTGLPIFVITNQAIVNRKLITPETLDGIHNRMMAEISKAGGYITKVYYCPHDTHEKCTCRKPEPGMLLQAAKEFDIDLAESFLIGDAWTDVEAGLTAGTRSILVMTGRGPQFVANVLLDYTVRVGAACDLEDAVTLVLSALEGQYISATPRLRRSFHMALHPQELIVL